MLVLPHIDLDIAGTIASLLLCAVTLCLLVYAYRPIRQTTLVSAWWWSVASVLSLIGATIADALLGDRHADASDALWFAAAALTFCPIISVLGSKRPQHRAWNFIVLSLWAIVALPAAEMLLLQRGQGLEVNDARGWFLWLLLLLLPINFVPTRFWFASLAVACGQALLLSPHLPLLRWSSDNEKIIAISSVTIGAVAALIVRRRPARAANRFDPVWQSFRDSFGLLWGLRVAERVNATARQLDWPFELTWQGLRNLDDGSPTTEIPADVERTLRQTLGGLLRRFVSPEWIAERTIDDVN